MEYITDIWEQNIDQPLARTWFVIRIVLNNKINYFGRKVSESEPKFLSELKTPISGCFGAELPRLPKFSVAASDFFDLISKSQDQSPD